MRSASSRTTTARGRGSMTRRRPRSSSSSCGGSAVAARVGCGRRGRPRGGYEFAMRLSCPGRARKREEPGARGHTTRCCGSGYGASRFFRWVPDLVALAQERSLHSSGTRGLGGAMQAEAVTRGLDHASRIYPTCAFQVPKSGKPDFGAVHHSLQDSFAKRMDCRVKPGNDPGKGRLTRAKRSAASASRMPSRMLTRITCRSRICGNGRRAGTIVTQNTHEETPCGHLA